MKNRTSLTLAAGAVTAVMLAPAPAADAGPTAVPDFQGTVQYSDDPMYKLTFKNGTATWSATGQPVDLGVTDTVMSGADSVAYLEGQTMVPAGVYDFTVTATTPTPTAFDYSFELTVTRERAAVRMASTNSSKVSRKKSFTVKARVQDQEDDSPGDITRAGVGSFTLTRNGHTRTFDAKKVAGSLHTAAPGYYDVKATIPSGLRRGLWTLTYTVTGDYYVGSRSRQVTITR